MIIKHKITRDSLIDNIPIKYCSLTLITNNKTETNSLTHHFSAKPIPVNIKCIESFRSLEINLINSNPDRVSMPQNENSR